MNTQNVRNSTYSHGLGDNSIHNIDSKQSNRSDRNSSSSNTNSDYSGTSPVTMDKASTADTLPPTMSAPYIPPGGGKVPLVPNPVHQPSERSREGGNEEAQPPIRSHLRLWKRIFGSRSLGKNENCKIQEKNTFIHFDDPDPDLIPSEPPAKSAPGGFAFVPSASRRSEQQPLRTTSQRSLHSVASSFQSSIDSTDSSPGGEHRQVVLANDALDRTKALSGGQVSLAEEVVYLSQVVGLQKNCLGSIGSAGHCTGNCMPCLMQVRWRAGKCVDPCKFGALCGRCHEVHSEEQLQKIQAKMRKLKKRVAEEKHRFLPPSSIFSASSKQRNGSGGGVGDRDRHFFDVGGSGDVSL